MRDSTSETWPLPAKPKEPKMLVAKEMTPGKRVSVGTVGANTEKGTAGSLERSRKIKTETASGASDKTERSALTGSQM